MSAAVPPGYKQTEVGVIPEDWELARLGDFCTCFSGGTPSTSNPTYYNGEIPWITSSDLNLARINEVEGRITAEGLTNSSAKMVRAGTLLLALYGATAGVVAMTEVTAAINQVVLAIQPNKHEVHYLFEYLRLRKDFLIKTYTQGGQPNFSGEIVKSFLIALPPTKLEQQAIAEALSDADALIEGLEALIAKKRQLKQGAMQELFLPTAAFTAKRLGEIFAITAGGDLRKNEFSDTKDEVYKYPIYSNALTNTGLYGYCKTFDYSGDCITVTARGSVGHAVARNHNFAAIGRLLVLSPIAQLNCSFVAEYINLKVEFANESTGVPQLTAPQISKYEVYFLPPDKQNAIATILSDMDAEIAALEGKLAKARRVKAGMMQDLLTGRVRLV